VAADIPAGLGYLAGGLAFAAVEVILIRNRHRLSRRLVDQWVLAATRAPRGLRWAYFHWRDERWRNEEFREKQLVWVWLPFAMGLPVFAIALLASAISEFVR
jgi:hypothetical protein